MSYEEQSEIFRSLKEGQGFPTGLAKALINELPHAFPTRIWIVDNSFSMSENDGKKFSETTRQDQKLINISCSRWEELQQTILYHARLADVICAGKKFITMYFSISLFDVKERFIKMICLNELTLIFTYDAIFLKKLVFRYDSCCYAMIFEYFDTYHNIIIVVYDSC